MESWNFCFLLIFAILLSIEVSKYNKSFLYFCVLNKLGLFRGLGTFSDNFGTECVVYKAPLPHPTPPLYKRPHWPG